MGTDKLLGKPNKKSWRGGGGGGGGGGGAVMDKHPIQGSSDTSSRFMLQKPDLSAGTDELLSSSDLRLDRSTV